MHDRPVILAVFLLTYLGIAVGHVPGLRLNRVGIALLGAIASMVLSGSSTTMVVGWVNWPTIFLLFGFLVLSSQLRLAGFYDRVAEGLAGWVDRPGRFLLVLMAASAGLAAFLNNDIVCFVFTPVAVAAVARRDLNPVPFVIGLALASNIGAAATPIGNAQGILIEEVAHLSFRHYVLWCFVPVALSLGAAYVWIARDLDRPSVRRSSPPTDETPPRYPFDRRHTLKGLVIFGAVIALCLTRLPKEVVVLVAAGIHLASPKFRTDDLLGLVDWSLLVLFLSLFVVTGAFEQTGYAEAAIHGLAARGFDLARPVNEILAAGGLTASINNAPAVMLLLKLVPLAKPTAAYTLALANSFGGNLILTASVANLIAVQQARRQGVTITFGDFLRRGTPVALASLLVLGGWLAVAG